MFRKRYRGLSSLKPLTGCSQPVVNHGFHDLNRPVKGDLQDVRNRLGLLVPPCTRFVPFEIRIRPPMDTRRKKELMDFFNAECAKNAFKHKPYYIDPYGRDQLLYYQGFIRSGRTAGGAPKRTAAQQNQKLEEAREEARQKREEQRLKDRKLWGEGGDKDFFKDLEGPTKPPAVSIHLYQPRKARPKSEWTTNMEVALALSRKKDIEQMKIRRLEKHQIHADDVRIKRGEKDAEKMERNLVLIREEDEKYARYLKSKVKYM